MYKSAFFSIVACLLLSLPGCGDEAVNESDELLGAEGKADGITKVQVILDKESYTPAEEIKVTVQSSFLYTRVFLPGCGLVTSLQRSSGSSWETLPPEQTCVWEGKATLLAPGATITDGFAAKPAGTYRVKVDFKVGCEESKPFSQCTRKVYTIYSPKFTVAESCTETRCQVDILGKIFAKGRHEGAFPTTSSVPLEMIKEWVAYIYEDLADEFQFVTDGSFLGDEMVAGTVTSSTARQEVAKMVEATLEYSDEPTDIPAAKAKALAAMDALIQLGVSFGFDGFNQNGCAAPTTYLLVIDTKDRRVWGLDLFPCEE